MQKLQDTIFSITKTTNLSPAVFNFLQPSDDCTDKTPLGGILSDSRHGWLALGPKFCVIDLKTGLKIAARCFGSALSNFNITVTSVVELPTPLTDNSQQLIISLECEDIAGMICVFHVNGSQILRCIQTDVVVTKLAVSDEMPNGSFTCFDGVIMAGTKSGEVLAFDLNRASLIQALKDISQGYEHLIRSETNAARLSFLPLNATPQIEQQRDLALENDDHIAVLLNEDSLVDSQYIFHNPDGTIRMKANKSHVRVSALQYIPQIASLVVGYNFGAFQIWNLMTLELGFTSQVNVECLPVTHFGFQEPCDDPRAFCYLWVIFSLIDRFEEEEFPLAVMYSLTYQGKRMLSDTKCLYQEFLTATIRFQLELNAVGEDTHLIGSRCISCHSYSINSTLGDGGEDSMLNICQLVWECWAENVNAPTQYNMLLFDLDQWYKDQMPATQQLHSSAFTSACRLGELCGSGCALDLRLELSSVTPYSHATRLEEHFYPNSLQYNCICLNTSETYVLSTIGVQRQIIASMDEIGPTILLNPNRLYNACITAGLTPLYMGAYRNVSQEQQRRFLLSVCAEARLARLLARCAHHWATGAHAAAGCSLAFLIDWCWKRAIELKENAKELVAPLFTSSTLPDRNVIRCLEHCVQQLTQLTGLLDSVLTKCCNLMVPEALSETEARARACSAAAAFLQATQWCVRVGLLPERAGQAPYPAQALHHLYNKRRLKLQRLLDNAPPDEDMATKPCPLLYIDQLIEHEFGGERIRNMWIKGGSEWNGLYPPPSLYSLLRLYLLPDVAEEHKHSLVLYLLVDYSMVYDDVRYEAVIRRLMQFPTMFGLSNTAIKATQAFWHLDHRDFDFALDQLQCLTGNTLSEWQHNVVLSALLAQKKTQAALQYLHVRKPAPVQNLKHLEGDVNKSSNRVNDHDKLEDWQSCCNLYLARGLVFEALDVIRMCVQNAASLDDKVHILNFFFKGCRNTGHLSNVLQITLLPFEEEVFLKYLEKCDEPQTSEILIMYYLQQARYLEAQQYNSTLKQNKSRLKELSTSVESLVEGLNREGARDTLVEVVCESLPSITNTVARTVLSDRDSHIHVIAPKPMSVFVQAKSPKNIFTYKSSFIQDTIENASETWINKPKMRKGLKRALNIEETPFICTPKLTRTRSALSPEYSSESSPPKRPKFDLTTPKTPKPGSIIKVSDELSQQMSILLDMPEVHTPIRGYNEREGAITPQSILKIRRTELDRDVPSPVDSRYLGDTDDELLETASNHTHYSDSTNKHLRFTIPTASEAESSPSPPTADAAPAHTQDSEEEREDAIAEREKEMDISRESFATTASHSMEGTHPMESPPKKLATEEKVKSRKSYKDNVRARRSHSVSINSSLSDDPNTSVESIADIPITLINPRYSGEKKQKYTTTEAVTEREAADITESEKKEESVIATVDNELNIVPPLTPRSRRAIHMVGESTPIITISRSVTPERPDSPVATPLRSSRITRSRSRTPSVSPRSSPLTPILEQPNQEMESEPHPQKTVFSIPRQTRSRSCTPERADKGVAESPRLEAITESPVKSSNESPTSSPTRRSLRSRSHTPESTKKETTTNVGSPRSLRRLSKTPEKLMSPKVERSIRKKPLSRLVLEHNAFAKTKQVEKNESESKIVEEKTDNVIECTPVKTSQSHTLMDVTFSPIDNKSVLQSSTETIFSETAEKNKITEENTSLKPLPPFITINETYFEKSVLCSYESSVGESSSNEIVNAESNKKEDELIIKTNMESLPNLTANETYFEKSVLISYESSISVTETSNVRETETTTEAKTVSEERNIDITAKDIGDISTGTCKSVLQDVSSLITSDSDAEINERDGWKAKMDSQDTATVIQKEKKKIGEIEREISEIEGDMSEDRDDESECSEDEEIIPAEEEEQNQESTEESEEEKSSDSDSEEEVISINDTSDESTTGSNKTLLIVEQISTSSSNKDQAEKTVEAIVEVHIEDQEMQSDRKDTQESIANESSSVDPLNQAQMSLITDDSSFMADNPEIKLYYSDTNVTDDIDKKVESTVKSDLHAVQIEDTVHEFGSKETEENTQKDTIISEVVDVVDSVDIGTKFSKTDTSKAEVEQQRSVEDSEDTEMSQVENTKKAVSRSRKRDKSAPRTLKENEDSNIIEYEERTKTPTMRKRAKSTASNKSTESEKTPEKIDTPSRRRAKTPTSTEVRTIITRRISKELAERSRELEDSNNSILEESTSATPKKRSTRSRSKVDDNASVASDSSFKSRAMASEDAGDVKPAQVRKGRKSILTSKPELSVIKEATAEDSKQEEKEDIMKEISKTERLTRHQKAVLECLLDHDEDASSTHSPPFDVQPIDRITLLNKHNFEGSPDIEEFSRVESPVSVASEPSKPQPSRRARAASEARATPKAAKITKRNVSVDVAAINDSPVRRRRASFARAVEALHTPKSKTTSTDLKRETDSQPGSSSPEEEAGPGSTPARRTRRVSTQSNTSQAKSETSKRSRK